MSRFKPPRQDLEARRMLDDGVNFGQWRKPDARRRLQLASSLPGL